MVSKGDVHGLGNICLAMRLGKLDAAVPLKVTYSDTFLNIE